LTRWTMQTAATATSSRRSTTGRTGAIGVGGLPSAAGAGVAAEAEVSGSMGAVRGSSARSARWGVPRAPQRWQREIVSAALVARSGQKLPEADVVEPASVDPVGKVGQIGAVDRRQREGLIRAGLGEIATVGVIAEHHNGPAAAEEMTAVGQDHAA